MKKSNVLLLAALLIGLLIGCSSASTDHNGRVCPKDKQNQPACNRTVIGHD